MTNGEVYKASEAEWRDEMQRRMALIRVGGWWSPCGCADVAEAIEGPADEAEARDWLQGAMDDPFSLAPNVWTVQPSVDA